MGPTAVVLDASVLVADSVNDERSHGAAASLLAHLFARGSWLYLPGIAMPEVAAAIARGAGDAELALEAVRLYRALPGVRVIPVDEPLIQAATAVAARQRIRGCDAVYVALAQGLGVPLVTLDREQRERSPSGVIAYSPESTLMELAASLDDGNETDSSS